MCRVVEFDPEEYIITSSTFELPSTDEYKWGCGKFNKSPAESAVCVCCVCVVCVYVCVCVCVCECSPGDVQVQAVKLGLQSSPKVFFGLNNCLKY